MTKDATPSIQRLSAWLVGMLVGIVGMGLFVGTAWAAPGRQTQLQDATPAAPMLTSEPTIAGTPTTPPKACADCHPDINDAWSPSSHAHAYDNETFNQRWKSLGEPGECLMCHTTGYQATTGVYTAQGVTCEACHGQAVEGHPPEVVPVRTDAEYCGTCHTITIGEWRLTGHAGAGVGCTDCHNPHNQKALFDDPDEMCVNCHKDDIGEHQNDVHIQKGIGCVECHELVIPPETPPQDGLAPTGHSFTITPATCVACHTDTLHIGKPIPGYEEGAKAVSASLPISPTLPNVVAAYTGGTEQGKLVPEQQIQALEATLASARLSTLFQGGIIGLMLGGTTSFFIARNQRRENEEEPQETEETDTPVELEQTHE
jgi:predicted CXXCH cytochrome family protein